MWITASEGSVRAAARASLMLALSSPCPAELRSCRVPSSPRRPGEGCAPWAEGLGAGELTLDVIQVTMEQKQKPHLLPGSRSQAAQAAREADCASMADETRSQAVTCCNTAGVIT